MQKDTARDYLIGFCMALVMLAIFVGAAQVGFERQDRALERERAAACESMGRNCDE